MKIINEGMKPNAALLDHFPFREFTFRNLAWSLTTTAQFDTYQLGFPAVVSRRRQHRVAP
jgi:hypothetical protein